jgi:D-alanine-D-alanine ligase
MRRVAILFGGRSGEHDVSRCSAASVLARIDRTRFEPIAIAIDRDGRWYVQKEPVLVQDPSFGTVLEIRRNGEWLVQLHPAGGQLVLKRQDSAETVSVDAVFPVMHGSFCEDGTLQGVFELAGVPYVGSGVLGSSLGMDKDAAKRILRDAGIPVVPWITVCADEMAHSFDLIAEGVAIEIGYPCFVKPANAGSSVGISKVNDEAALKAALDHAFEFDIKVLVEKSVACREIECAVMGNEYPKGSVLGEITPCHEFYSYEAKYIDADGAKLMIPAPMDDARSAEIRSVAEKAYEALCLEGLARVDFFLDKDSGSYYLNEVNTLPGFTSVSMYPKLWEASGLSYPDLISALIDLAFERYAAKSKLKTEYRG